LGNIALPKGIITKYKISKDDASKIISVLSPGSGIKRANPKNNNPAKGVTILNNLNWDRTLFMLSSLGETRLKIILRSF
jgi:hypothetical protein